MSKRLLIQAKSGIRRRGGAGGFYSVGLIFCRVYCTVERKAWRKREENRVSPLEEKETASMLTSRLLREENSKVGGRERTQIGFPGSHTHTLPLATYATARGYQNGTRANVYNT